MLRRLHISAAQEMINCSLAPGPAATCTNVQKALLSVLPLGWDDLLVLCSEATHSC